jgi:hypothetical protein
MMTPSTHVAPATVCSMELMAEVAFELLLFIHSWMKGKAMAELLFIHSWMKVKAMAERCE